MNSTILKAVAISSLVFAPLLYVERFSAGSILMCLVLSIPPGMFYYLFLSSLNKESNIAAAERDFRGFLYTILSYKSKSIPLIKALEGYKATTSEIAEAINEIRGRIASGSDPISAIGTAAAKRHIPIGILQSRVGQEYISIENELRYDERMLKERSIEQASSTQRNATLNMFVSTIAPSFIIFIFTGSIILSRSFRSVVLFSVIMLVALPIVNMLTTSLLMRHSYA